MSILDKEGWYKIDSKTEEKYVDGIRYVKPIDLNPLRLDCSVWKRLISSVEDVETCKSSNTCSSCYDLYYYPNKEKWENGWRPNI